MRRTPSLLTLLLIMSAVVQGQTTKITEDGSLRVQDMRTTRATTVLPAKLPGGDGLQIVGPAESDVGKYVHLEVLGLPPIDSSQTLEEALKWTRNIAMRVQQPPESEKVDFDVTLGFRLLPVLSWKLTLDLKASVSGDYAVAFAMPGEVDEPVQLVTHGIRFGSGPIPPPPDPVIGVSPDTPFSSNGPVGGPFTPPTKSYLISNVGDGILQWSIKSTVPWLRASIPSGSLGAGQSIETFIEFTDDAKGLEVGVHAGAVTFRNLTNDKGSSPRLVVLTVKGDPPPPPIQELWGVVVYQTEDLDDYGPGIAQVLASQRLRELDKKFYWRIFDKDVKDQNGNTPSELKPWLDLLGQKNLPMPHLFLISQDGKLAYNVPLPDSIDEVVDLVQKYLPKGRN